MASKKHISIPVANATKTLEKEVRKRRPLTPRILDAHDNSYHCVEELEYVVENTSCRNIAITGVYGSGKSSVIDTYLAKQTFCKKPLKISLSTFFDESDDEIMEEKPVEKKSYNADVEYKIVQHLLYKSDPRKLRQSRFDRISHNTEKNLRILAIWAMVAVLAALILFEPAFLQVNSIYGLYWKVLGIKAGSIVNTVADILSALYLLYCLGWLVYKCLLHYYPGRISKVKAQGVEVDLAKNSSVFNQLLDEIVYSFNVNRYDLVIFEDLDRLYQPHALFLKLRELNILLNESETFQNEKFSVRFVYAVRDDVFTKDLRTKCFDYIIPVAPVVDHFNASDYLIEHKKELFDTIEDKDLRELGVWISGFRELNNILNEFGLYKKLVMRDGMAEGKLLAIIIYKNLFPLDYSTIHSRDGLLYNVFDKKQKFILPLTSYKVEQLNSLNEQIKTDRDAIAKIKKDYLNYMVQEYHVQELIDGNERYTLNEVASSEVLFDRFRKDDFKHYFYVDEGNEESGTLNYNLKFIDIEEEVGQGLSYNEAVYPLISRINTNTEKADKLRRTIRRVENESLTSLFNKFDGDYNKERIRSIYKEVKGKNAKIDEEIVTVIQAMIRSGYIMEDYPTYVSYYHSGSLQESDFNFLNSLRQGIAKPFDTVLDNPELIIKQLVTDNFTAKSILNYSLLNYLMGEKQHAHLLEKFIETARKYPDFIIDYSKSVENPYGFLALVFKGWDHPINFIKTIENDRLRSDMLIFYFFTGNCDARLQNEEIEFIKNSYSFINGHIQRIDLSRLKIFVNQRNVVFHSLEPAVDSAQNALLDYVRTTSRYDINYNNLRVIFGKDFETKSYTTIFKHREEGVKTYLTGKNLNVTTTTFPDTSISEEDAALLDLVNQQGVDEKWLESYVARQQFVFDTLQGVADSRQAVLMANDRVAPLWENVLEYYRFHPSYDTVIGGFITRHNNTLKQEKCNGEPELIEQLKKTLFCNNTNVDNDTYKLLLSSFDGPLQYEDITELSEERSLELIKRKWYSYSKEVLMFIKEVYSEDCFARFVINYFDEISGDDEVDWGDFITNHLGINLLNSELTMDRKIVFIDLYDRLDETSDDASYHAELICFYYVQNGAITSDTDQELLIQALGYYDKPDAWRCKITLINMMNGFFEYNYENERNMIASLRSEMYSRLNSFGGRAHFDINDENRRLLTYLKTHGHYVNNFHETDGQIWVSFKKK